LKLDEKVLSFFQVSPDDRDQLPRVTGISTSPGMSKCLANSSLAKELR